jgi:superfamily II DNA or RNA helicase
MAGANVYGTTAWGRWFAEALEDFDESGRLSRGKSYANTGKVSELAVESCVVSAKVRGHSRPFYKVKIVFPSLSKAQRKELQELIESDLMLLARIEAGESPPELVETLKRRNVDLIPRSWASMKRSCSCPDWGDPCKHMAAVYYLLAREIDRDPRLLFRLRGVDLPARRGDSSSGAAPVPDSLFVPRTAAPRLELETDAQPGAIPADPPRPPRFESYASFVISLIPPSTSFSADDFSLVLAEFYHRAMASIAGEDDEEDSGRPGDSMERRFSAARFAIHIPEACASGRLSIVGSPRPLLFVDAPGIGEKPLSLLAASTLFLGFSSPEGNAEYSFLFYFFRLLKALRSACAFVPFPVVDGEEREEKLRMAWGPLPRAAELMASFDELSVYDPGILKVKGAKGSRGRGRGCVDYLTVAFLSEWVQSLAYRPKGMKAGQRELVELFFDGAAVDISRPGERGLAGAIAAWLAIYSIDFGKYRYRLTIDSRDPDGLLFDLKLDLMMGDGKGGPPKAVSLRKAAELGGPDVFSGPAALSSYLPELRSLATERSVRVAKERLSFFLGEAPALLAKLGVEVILPKYLRKALEPRLVLKVESKGSGSLRSYLDMGELLSYDWRIAIGDETIDVKTFERLVKSKKAVVLFHDGFVRIDPEEAARLIERAKSARAATPLAALKARLAGEASFSADAEEIMASLFRERELERPQGLAATLRPYQERGYRWIASNLLSGFGCILADDMGLGKTVQSIAVMQRFEEDGLLPDGVLVVAPAALLANWERELAKFAPGLRTRLYHGAKRDMDHASRVFLTTYQTVVRDSKRLEARPFSLLVVDEAHILKNSATKAAMAVKFLRSTYRLALSGTPVENRLEDLRSIFDFAFPGYLGGAAEFKREWRMPIEVDRDAKKSEEFKRITAPFLMRRLKTDKSIIDDLPEKIESDEYARLGPEQAALYKSVVDKGLSDLGTSSSAVQRQALVLGLFTSLKQICDHPRVYDKESPPDPALSGKCGLLLALLEEILERREKVLVFSQYVQTLTVLKTVVQEALGEESLLYHGGMTAKRRDEAVSSFQNDDARRIMLVSLKAGGLGLNLTAASRVIHYDLWFNPAVENQATDRAFRIGQTRNVFVHRFITLGTFEEKLDAMIKSKRELAEMSVASGESWLSRMSDKELHELFSR